MYSNMCVKIALCLALIVSIDGNVLKHRALPLSPEGMTVESTVRSKEDPRHPQSTMKIDINEKDKNVEMSMAEAPSGVLEHLSKANNGMATLGDRIAGFMTVGSCPEEHTSHSNICVNNKVSEDYPEINISEVKNNEPTLENRARMVGMCAAGFTPRGRFCIPDDY